MVKTSNYQEDNAGKAGVTEPRKCIKCGDTNAQYYSGSGNTCKECVKKRQRVRNATKRVVAKVNMEERLRYNFSGADCWVNGIQVMSKGILLGQEGQDWWSEKKTRHEQWLRRKRKKENAIAALPAEELSIEV